MNAVSKQLMEHLRVDRMLCC